MKVDMSPKAITARIRLASEMRDLCLSLGKAKPVINGAEPAQSGLQLETNTLKNNDDMTADSNYSKSIK